jgi:hypothetical protein
VPLDSITRESLGCEICGRAPFHWCDPVDNARFHSRLAEINAAVAKAGHAEIRYRVHKVTGKQAGNYNYMWEAAFPSGAVYDSVHQNPAFRAAIQKHPEFDRLRNFNAGES